MSANLARLHATGRTEIVQPAPIDSFQMLDKYTGGVADERPRVPWLATISAGYLDTKRDPPIPRASRKTDEQWVHMTAEDQERAPGLYAALKASNFRYVDVALPFDDPDLFLQQRFEKRSQTRLEAYGDQYQLTELLVRKQGNQVVASERRPHPAGSPDYARLVRECNVSVSLFFALAEWNGRQPNIYFPPTDGLGVYRLRFTSRNSLRELVASLRQISSLTGGRLAGIPLRLSLDWRDVADPTGTRRTIGVWRLRFMPPEGLKLTPGVWQDLASKGLEQGDLLRLPAPSVESLEDAVQTIDADLDEPADADVQALEDGPPCDAAFYQKAWFARVKDTTLDHDDARAEFVSRHTGGRYDSLSAYLQNATEEQAAALIAAAGHSVGSEKTAQHARRYEEIFGTDDDPPIQPPTAAEKAAPRDPATGEVMEEPPPTHERKRARLNKLLADAKKRGITADAPMPQPGEDPLDAAISYWEQRIADVDLDRRLAAEQGQQVAF